MDQHHGGLRAANALLSYVRYLGKTFWPAGLSPFYTYGSVQLPSWQVAGAAALLAAVSVAALLRLRRRPWLAFGWCWYLGVLVPAIGLVQVGGQPLADRYTYLPSIGLSVALCWGGWTCWAMAGKPPRPGSARRRALPARSSPASPRRRGPSSAGGATGRRSSPGRASSPPAISF